jgi:hypothetical protein
LLLKKAVASARSFCLIFLKSNKRRFGSLF